MSIHVLELKNAPDQSMRFIYSPRNEFKSDALTFEDSGLTFGTIRQVTTGYRPNFVSKHTLESYKMWCDFLRERAKAGLISPHFASARVSTWTQDGGTSPFYTGVQKEVVVEDNPSAVQKIFDGTYRILPLSTIERTPRGYRLPFLVTSQGRPIGDYVTGVTKSEIVEKLLDGAYQLSKDIVLSYPFASPTDIPAPVPAVFERVYSSAELAAVPPYAWPAHEGVPTWEGAKANIGDPAFQKLIRDAFEVYSKIPASQELRQKIEDPIFNEAVAKLSQLHSLLLAENERRAAQDTENERLRKLKDKFKRDDEDRIRKGDIL